MGSDTLFNLEIRVGNKDLVMTVKSNLIYEKLLVNLRSNTDTNLDSKFLLQNPDLDSTCFHKKRRSVHINLQQI